ncbi:MAG: PGF-CTERM sorting domain-containing protein [Candidatus Poseidoniaceae archaeon]|nr:PGF-CTERM sorting domain-containing protein [Candidatus Poseidoniaceae archaeon]
MMIMATSPLLNNTNELQPNALVKFEHGGDIANGTAILSGTLTWQDDAWNASWICNGGLSLVTPSDWNNFIASGEYDPHNYTSWSIGLTGAGSYYTENAPEGEWVVTAGLGCEDDAGVPRAAGGQFGDVHENPPTVNLTNGTTVADVDFTLIEFGGEGPSVQDLMDMLDTDGDGVLSLEELIDGINGFNAEDGEPPLSEEDEGYIGIAFNESDTDGNGFLDVDELGYFFELMEDNGDITFVCGDGTEIPFELVNDGTEDCADGSDEPQDFDSDGETDNWFDCADGTTVSMDVVNDGTWDCPDGEDEGEGGEEEFEPDCIPSSMNMQLKSDGAGGIYFEIDNACTLSAADSSTMRDMFDMYIGNGDGVLNESEADSAIDMMMYDSAASQASEEESEEDGDWTIDGTLVEMTETVTYIGLADPSVPISMSMTMSTESIPWDGTSGSHTVMFVEDSDYVDDNPDDECMIGQAVSNSDFVPTSIVLTPATQFTITDDGSGNWEVEEIPDSVTGECDSRPETATMVFDSVGGDPVDTEPTCAYTWTAATDTSWETETGITLGPDGDETMTFEPGSYMIAVQCTDAENDVINAAWSNADGTLSASETGNGTVFGWVQFTIPDGVTGTMDIDYEWDSTSFGSNGTITFDFASNASADPDDEIVGTGGGLPGFTSVLAITALLGAAMISTRRKD